MKRRLLLAVCGVTALTALVFTAWAVAQGGTPVTINGNTAINGVLSGNNSIGGSAASIQGFGTGGNAGVFAFKYDKANFGDKPQAIQIWNSSSGVFKTFIIDNPLDKDRYIVHASIEGPEGAVYYRGSARLQHGVAKVMLPHYFEGLTRKEDRTVILTNIGGFDRIAVKKSGQDKIVNGSFVVVADNPNSTQEFDWEVKAVRADGPLLVAEPLRKDVQVGGFGPYTYEVAPTRASR